MKIDNDPSLERRGQPDRRSRPTSPLDSFLGWRRRSYYRRVNDAHRFVFVDRYSVGIFLLILLLLFMTIADGLFTLELLDTDCEEANPLMKYLLERGHMVFLLGKYILTAIGLPFVIAFKNRPLFRTRFRVGYVIPAFVALYLLLLYYQIGMIREREYFLSLRALARSNHPAVSARIRSNPSALTPAPAAAKGSQTPKGGRP